MVHLSRIPSLTFKALLLLTLGFLQNVLAQDYKTVEATFPGLAAGDFKIGLPSQHCPRERS